MAPQANHPEGAGQGRARELIARDFGSPDRLSHKWYGDGTEIGADQGKLYRGQRARHGLAAHRVGFGVGEHHDADLTQAALWMAVAVRGGKYAIHGVIMHTD